MVRKKIALALRKIMHVPAVADKDSDPLFLKVLEKGLLVLRSFTASRRSMGLHEIAEITQLSKSSVQRIVHTLEMLGYVSKNPKTRQFTLTAKIMDIGYNYLAADTLVDIANPFLAELSSNCGETVNLVEPSDLDMIYVARFTSHRFIPMHMPIGSRVPMYCSAVGRAYLSALDEETRHKMLEAMPLVRHTAHTIVDVEELKSMLLHARTAGYATNAEELYPGDMAVASPIIGGKGQPIAAVCVITPASRWKLDDAQQMIAPKVVECAHAISNAMRAVN